MAAPRTIPPTHLCNLAGGVEVAVHVYMYVYSPGKKHEFKSEFEAEASVLNPQLY